MKLNYLIEFQNPSYSLSTMVTEEKYILFKSDLEPMNVKIWTIQQIAGAYKNFFI